jgi:glycosyltransferase involved in cell wall biosynthesis
VTDAVIAVSGDIGRALRRSGVPARKVHVVRNGVDTDALRPPSPEERAAARAALAIPEGALAIGSVGRLVPEKDYPSLVRAAASLAREGREVRVVLAGEGPERERIAAAAREGGIEASLLLLGTRDDVAGVLRALDVFVLSSVSEGLSNTLLEAAAAGLARVATRVGGNPEVVRDGEDGLLVSASDSSALAEALGRLARDAALRERLAAGARARCVAEFSMASMAAGHMALLDRFARLRNATLARAA